MRKRWQWVDGVLVLGLLLIAVGVGMEYRKKVAPKTEVEVIKGGRGDVLSVGDDAGRKLFVDVGGAVEEPGVYEMETGARIKDALVAAGGLSAEADRGWVEKNLNQAGEVWDGQKIYIPETEEGKVQDSSGRAGDDKININTASAKELDELPGIGLTTAGKIIEYREANNGFRNVEEIKLVKGIGDKLFEDMRDKISI